MHMNRPAAISAAILLVIVGGVCADTPVRPAESAPRDAGGAPRVVSFSPAITDILLEIGFGDCVVGVTRFCRLPDGVSRPRLGDQFTVNAEKILSVRPDVILTQTDPRKFTGVTDVDPHVRVEQLRIERLEDIPAAIRRIGRILGRPDRAGQHAAAFEAKIDYIRRKAAGKDRPRVLFVMGTDRPTAAGANNFIGDLIVAAGGINAGADIPGQTRWHRTHIDDIVSASPQVIICMVEKPARAEDARQYWMQWSGIPAAASGRVHVVTSKGWTIPSTNLADLSLRMYRMLHPASPATAPAAVEAGTSLWVARLYRLLAAAVVGAALAAAGAALQGLLRNPLAEPYILGISSGAGVGVLLGLALSGWWAVPQWASTPALAFIGAITTCVVVYTVAQRRGRLDSYALILSGVIINTFNAAIMLAMFLYIDPHRIADFSHWAMGRLPDSVDVVMLAACGAFVAAGWAVLAAAGGAFNVLGLGDEVAASSGVGVNRLRIATFACVGLMTAAAVALAGPVGFLGLIVPHIVRLILGPEHRRLILVSGLAGAGFLVGAEALCRHAGAMVGLSLIPVGIITALCGGPFFIFLLRRRFREVSP